MCFNIKMSTLLAILLCSVVAAQSEEVAKSPVLLPELKNGIESLTDKLAGILYKQAPPNSNVVVSPINIFGIFSLLLYGADGGTREEIANFLGFPNTNETFLTAHKNFGEFLKSLEIKKTGACDFPDDANETTCIFEDVSIANGVFLHKEFSLVSSYAEGLQSYYNGGVENVDFAKEPAAATDRINKWVAEKTHNLIPNLLKESVDASVRVVLAATVYFSAKWPRGTFKFRRTKPEKFTTDISEVNVEYMFNENTVPYYEDTSFSAISLPYKGNDFETIFVLPNINTSIAKFLETFSKTEVEKIFNESETKNMFYKIPYIETEWSSDLTEPLKSLNLTGIFAGANLTKLISQESGPLKVSKVSHATKLKVDEKGTIASGATAIEIALRAGRGGPPPIAFFVNRPFLLIIRHRQSSVPLFTALIRNPTV